MNVIILYLAAGVGFNLLWDTIVTKSETEENRFTLLERLTATLIWPLALGFSIYYTIKALLK